VNRDTVARLLARFGVIQTARLRETTGLAWPRVITGFAIMSKRAVDLAIVGVALGSTAVAGLTVANAYWMLGKFLAIGLAGGTISLASQSLGAGDDDRAGRVVGASLLLGVAISLPAIALLLSAPEWLARLLGDDPGTVGYAARYLVWVAPGLAFEAVNLVASRAYAAGNDTHTPMTMRAGGAVLNVALSAGLVFGAGLGVAGAALGTTLSTAAVTLAFGWGLSGRHYRGRGACPVSLSPASFRVETTLVRRLLSVSTPLIARRVAQGAVVFPLLAVAAAFGPVAIAAVGVARQIRAVAHSPGWGFSIAASTLVGQAIGGADEAGAAAYGREITQLSVLVYLVAAALVAALAAPLAGLFVAPAEVALTAAFVLAAAVSLVPLGIDASVTGTLRGAGDTRVPFLATLVGLYLAALPLAWLGTVTPLGVLGLQLALVVEAAVPMAVNLARFRTGGWKTASRPRPSPGD
jgi:putative MATE family efflux protein